MHNPVKKKLARTFFLYFLFDSPHVFLFFVLGKGKEVGAFGWDLLSLKGEKGEKREKETRKKVQIDALAYSKRQVQHIELELLSTLPARCEMSREREQFVQRRNRSVPFSGSQQGDELQRRHVRDTVR